MRKRFRLGCALAPVIGALLPLPGLSATGDETPEPGILYLMQSNLSTSKTITALRQELSEVFDKADLDGGGFGPSDVELSRELRRAEIQAIRVQSWAGKDLDGDGIVTRDELETFFLPQSRSYLRSGGVSVRPTAEQQQEVLNRLINEALLYDLDQDGTIAYGEIVERARDEFEANVSLNRHDVGLHWALGSLDQDGDDATSREEFVAALDAALNWLDRDGDDQIDDEEVSAFRTAVQAARDAFRAYQEEQRKAEELRQRAAACGPLDVPESTTFVVIGAYEGMALSTARVGPERGVTTVADIEIGDVPDDLFLLLTNEGPLVWRLGGDIGRVAAVAVDEDSAGVIGLDASRIQFVLGKGCDLRLWSSKSAREKEAIEVITAMAGRAPDQVIASYELGQVRVPGGAAGTTYSYPGAWEPITSGPAEAVWKDLVRFNPGGVVEIAPEEVVARAEVASYGLLPQEAGLARLVQSGAIEPALPWDTDPVEGVSEGDHGFEITGPDGVQFQLGGGDDGVISGGRVIRLVGGSLDRSFVGNREYLLRDEIAAPPGLVGAHVVTFLQPPGVKPPSGNLGGSEVRPVGEQ